ncbi:RNI-like superfamily protein [Striga asiatica]|uniref:RNI-like superfamily protein n=1 Tax=Striga asiatica TaxID=4170 RepID=A0A5A7P8K9_STRAF|nr:RNI-like superfamily protein [Striga asiatica]
MANGLNFNPKFLLSLPTATILLISHLAKPSTHRLLRSFLTATSVPLTNLPLGPTQDETLQANQLMEMALQVHMTKNIAFWHYPSFLPPQSESYMSSLDDILNCPG